MTSVSVKHSFLALFLLILASPIFSQTPEDVSHKTATVYFFHRGLFAWSKIKSDGKVIAKVRDGSYIDVELVPGDHYFTCSNGGRIWARLQADKTYYFGIEVNSLGGFGAQATMSEITEEQGKLEIKHLRSMKSVESH